MPVHIQSEPRLATCFSHSLDEPSRNVSDLISVVRVAADAVDEATNIFQRMRDLALQASNMNNAHSVRTAIQEEFTALCSELNRIAETTSFGGKTLLNGSFGSQLFQIGESSDETTVVITLGNIRADSVEMGGKKYVAENAVSPDWVVTTSTNLSLHYSNKHGEATSITLQTKQGDHLENVATYITAQTDDNTQAFVGEDGKLQIFASTHKVKGEITIGGNLGTEIGFGAARDVTIEDSDLTSTGGAQQAMAVIDDGALEAVDCQRTALGVLRQPLVHVINSLGSIDKQVATAKDRIVDSAVARESTDLTKSQMLARAAAMVLAQARQSPSSVLSLVH
ncbi:unnamed protein product [Porites evermanni]|uniref:Flagellin n=1 Tax=Porites evermanni TaxID=104178 RepID=A0ABN8SGW3_9CNID|nr:unnamed protein product [Porites evermanni]